MDTMGSRDGRSACPDDTTISSFMAGTLSESRQAAFRRHLDDCDRCALAVGGAPAEEMKPTRRPEPGNDRTANKIRVGEELANKYRVESILGSGGMGTVLRAFQPELNRHVAIKVMHTELLTTEGAARRFSLEARATAALKSKHAVRILDIDRLPSGAPFIVMEHLEGRDLGRVVAEEGPLSVELATAYMVQATDALEEAHERGVVHRDVKPQNMILTKEGIVKVVDFGLAKALRAPGSGETDSVDTKTNMLVGSPHYMSPEQMRSPHDVDERTDIWSLGATYYHLLSGIPPFLGTSLEMLSPRIAAEPPTPLSKRRADMPRSVDGIIGRCLEKDPGRRFATVAELRLALEDVISEVTAARTVRQPDTDHPSTRAATTRRGLPTVATPETEAETAPYPLHDTVRHPKPAIRPEPAPEDGAFSTTGEQTQKLTKRRKDGE